MDNEINFVEDEFSLKIEKPYPPFYKNRIFIILAPIFSFFIILGIILYIVFSFSNESEISKEIFGIINCTYNLEIFYKDIQILGNEFEIDFDIDIIIDGNKIKYSKKYDFSSNGVHNVQYLIYNKKNISIDYMFKNVYTLKSVEMISDKNLEIYSMISAFENCENLEKVVSKGIISNNVKSMKKLFYNTKIKDFNFTEINISTNNVEDMSYMFSAIKSERINIYNLDTNKVKNMSHMFEDCSDLTYLNFSELNTSNLIDISYMFNSCESLIELNLNEFKTSTIKNMPYIFKNCISLSSLDISNFNTNLVEDLSGFFENCHSLTFEISI